MGIGDVRESWEHASQQTKAMIAGGLLVIAAGWIAYLVWPAPPVTIEVAGEAKQQQDAIKADRDALAAMSMDDLKAEVRRRESALSKANRSGDQTQIGSALEALEHAREVMIMKQSSQPPPPPAKGP